MQSESNIPDVLCRLREIASRIPAMPSAYPLKEPVFGQGVPQIDIDSLEGVIKVNLPEDFAQFQRVCGSIEAMDIWNGYSLLDAARIGELLVCACLPQITTTCPAIMPIGGDGGGNMFLMVLGDSNHVAKWNHETSVCERLADAFSEFLERMLDDWEHFVSRDHNWNYMAG